MGKAIRNACLGTVKQLFAHHLFDSEPVRHTFYILVGILVSKVVFCNKTTCFLKHRCLNRDLSVVTPYLYAI